MSREEEPVGDELRTVRKPGTIHVVVTAVMSGLIAVIGYLVHQFLPHLIITVWPTTGLFACSGIWFGLWGVLASFIGNSVASVSALGLAIGITQSTSTIVQALIPAWAFRFFKADPRINTSRDMTIFMAFGVVIPGFLSTLIGPTVWYIFGVIPSVEGLFYVAMPGWFFSNLVITPAIALPLLKATSGAVMRSRAYVKRWLA